VDRVSIDRFECEHRHYLTVLHQRLAKGSYRPLPVRRVEIDKPGSTVKRPLGIPAVVESGVPAGVAPGSGADFRTELDPEGAHVPAPPGLEYPVRRASAVGRRRRRTS